MYHTNYSKEIVGMLENPIQRDYARTDSWSVIARASKDDGANQWFDVRIPNIAAGGMLFVTDRQLSLGDVLWFDMQIDPMTPGIIGVIPMKVKGEIKGDRGSKGSQYSYSVEFTEILKSDRIRLDELVTKTNHAYKLDSDSGIFDR
jgi:hypothetical protein